MFTGVLHFWIKWIIFLGIFLKQIKKQPSLSYSLFKTFFVSYIVFHSPKLTRNIAESKYLQHCICWKEKMF